MFNYWQSQKIITQGAINCYILERGLELNFIKYSATGNDFIAIDNRKDIVSVVDFKFWQKLCQRKTGVGADGILLLEKSSKHDFKMRYLNSDGREASMCGNGARAITHFAHYELNIRKDKRYQFETLQGEYQASIYNSDHVKLKMTELSEIGLIDLSLFAGFKNSLFLNTGVPHSVFILENLDEMDVFSRGREISQNKIFPNGTNVNFVEIISADTIRMRIYERGVENETLSCGTGAVAAAITMHKLYDYKGQVEVCTPGGRLIVNFDSSLDNIYLCGKVEKIFSGVLENSLLFED